MPARWLALLEAEGFAAQAVIQDGHNGGQQIFAAISDGVVRQHKAFESEPLLVASPRPAVVTERSEPVLVDNNTAVTQDPSDLEAQAVAYVKQLLCPILKLSADQLDARKPLQSYGIDSILVVQLTEQLREIFPAVSTTLFFEQKNLQGVARALLADHRDILLARLPQPVAAPASSAATVTPKATTDAAAPRDLDHGPAGATVEEGPLATARRDTDIAIIGISGRFPEADNVQQFWRNLTGARNCIREIPSQRWDWRQSFDPEKAQPGCSYSRWGGFVSDVDQFDPLFFRISPLEAENIDPQERLFLQTAHACIEDAGYSPASLSETRRVGVFAGVMNQTYGNEATHWSVANRVSYSLDFQGPSLAVDTACASSLTALHLAVESLNTGSCECAIAGGVNLVLSSQHYIGLSQMGVLATDDRCKSFAANADGFVDSEAVVALLLKPLSRAEADGDAIYAVIKGTAINAGGHTHGYSVPNPQAQQAVVVAALQRAGLDPRTLSYIEAHGTGTALGDPVEIAALSKAFAQLLAMSSETIENASADEQRCAIGSVKSNIGHAESAAGLVGLVKVLMQLQHAQLAPTLHAQTLNPEIRLAQSPFALQHQLAPWQRPRLFINGVAREVTRRAGVSSFGAGGANAHVVVEEYIDERPVGQFHGSVLLPLSAMDEERLHDYLQRLQDFITTADPELSLASLAWTLQTGRTPLSCRLLICVDNVVELRQKLDELTVGHTTIAGVFRGNTTIPAADFSDPQLRQLVQQWLSGEDVDWSTLYHTRPPKRLHAPGYPFARERYWRQTEANPVDAVSEHVGDHFEHYLISALAEAVEPYRQHPQRLSELYQRWLATSLDILQQHAGPTLSAGELWQRYSQQWLADPELASRARLAHACVTQLADVLCGQRPATEVLFPEGSMALVEAIYQGYPEADRYQQILATAVAEFVRQRRQQSPTATIRILEIGAGTGATTAAVLKHLSAMDQPVTEYCYSDLSISFLNHAREKFASQHPFLTTQIIDIEKPLAMQGVPGRHYDCVIAANVLHATHDIRATLKNVRQAMTDDGLLALNELNSRSLLAHLSFGLLEGWWRYRDPELRIPGTPAISPQRWQSLLLECGFASPEFPAAGLHDGDQQIIVSRLGAGAKIFADPHPRLEPTAVSLSPLNQNSLRSGLEQRLKALIAGVIKLSPARMTVETTFDEYGIDSIVINQINRALKQHVDEVPNTLLFEYNTIARLAGWFIDQHPQASARWCGINEPETTIAAAVPDVTATITDVAEEWSAKGNDTALTADESAIAIIGLSCRYPQAGNSEEFWRLLSQGDCAVSAIPEDRWDWRDWYEADPDNVIGRQRTYSKWGAFIHDCYDFDPLFFNIPPREAADIDPQERLFLQQSWWALEDAGYDPVRFSPSQREHTGVFAGITKQGYQLYTLNGGRELPNTSFASVANRVSYHLDLRGPSKAIDTMCSSSLVALHEACDYLRHGGGQLAIAGGVNLYLHPLNYVTLARNQVLADSDFSLFTPAGRGFVPGEGCGAVVLKPYQAAVADGDDVYAIIRASAVNHNGRTNAYMASNPERQAQVIRTALQQAQLEPADIDYVEVAASGSEVGDSIELRALSKVFGGLDAKTGRQRFGSLKGNIGHSEAASGIAQLSKVLLSMRHERLVATPTRGQLSNELPWSSLPLRLQTETAPWQQATDDAGQRPRRAGISAVGGGGVNAHVIVEQPGLQASLNAPQPVVFVLSAKNAEVLQELAITWVSYLDRHLEQQQPLDLVRIAWTLQQGRAEMPVRLALVCDTPQQLRDELQTWLENPEASACVTADTGRLNVGAGASAAIEAALAQRSLHGLADMWVQGESIRWPALYSAPVTRLTGLPLYPFARQYCRSSVSMVQSVSTLEQPVFDANPQPDPVSRTFENKAAEFYTVVAHEYANDDIEEYLTLCPFPQREPGFSMTAYFSDQDFHHRWQSYVLSKQIELRQVLFFKEPLNCMQRVLDFGCGHGADVIQLAEMFPNLHSHGFTITEDQARLGNQRINSRQLTSRARIFHKDSGKDAFPDRYDLIFGIEVSFHIRNKEGLFGNIQSALKEGGRVLLMDYIANLSGAIVDPAVEISIPTREQWPELLARHALRIDELIDVSPEIGNFVYDPDCDKNTAHLDKVAQDSFRNFTNQAISLERGWVSYVLLKLSKDSRMSVDQLLALNTARLASAIPYRQALEEMQTYDARLIYPRAKTDPSVIPVCEPETAATVVESGVSQAEVTECLATIFTELLGYQRDDVIRLPFSELGISSINAVELLERINTTFALTLPTSVVFESENLQALATMISERLAQHRPVSPASAATAAVSGISKTDVAERLTTIFIDLLGYQRDDIIRLPFSELGISSINAVELLERINTAFALTLPTSVVFESENLQALATMISERLAQRQPVDRLPKQQQPDISTAPTPSVRPSAAVSAHHYDDEAIAVIGLACRCAGADDAEAFWQLVSEGHVSTQDIHRADWLRFFEQHSEQTVPAHYGYMDSGESFDPAFFGISPKEAQAMHVSQRVLLETGYHALEDAGCAPGSLKEQHVGVFVGVMNNVVSPSDDFSHYAMLGGENSILSSRLAFFLNLKGPALTVNTACSSSMVALDIACQHLRGRSVSMALAGGVSVYDSPAHFVSMSNIGMLSPTGRCRPFDADADGTVVGDGVGMLVLKRVSDAERDGDRIYAVIKASGTNQDGRTSGITVPSFSAQSQLEKAVYQRAGIDVEDIQYVETHGTGTHLGDPIEIHALNDAFRQFTPRRNFCALGALKANIGHAAAAAGVLGVIKVLLAMQHGRLPPMAHYRRSNAEIDFDQSPFYVPCEAQEWPLNRHGRRLAVVSAFGFSGTNAHMVLESAGTTIAGDAQPDGPYPILLSARTEKQLREAARRLAAHVNRYHPPLAAVAHTLQTGRDHWPERLGLMVNSEQELLAQLQQFCDETNSSGIGHRGRAGAPSALMTMMQQDDEFDSMLARWVSQRRYDRLLELWIGGEDICWEALHRDHAPVRISLPGYPFDRQWRAADRTVPSISTRVAQESQVSKPESVSTAGPISTFVEQWQPAALQTGGYEPKVLLCLLSQPEHQRLVTQALKRMWPDCELSFVSQGPGGIDRHQPESFSEAFARLAGQNKRVDTVLYLWPLEDRDCIEDLTLPMQLIQGILAAGFKPERIVCAGPFIDSRQRCLVESWLGIERSLAQAVSGVQFATLYQPLSSDQRHSQSQPDMDAWITLMLAELQAENLDSCLYQHQQRFVLNRQPVTLPPVNLNGSMIRTGGCYLITGGNGGLGMIFAEFLAQQYHARLVLIGRRPSGTHQAESLQRLHALGGEAIYLSADVSNREAMDAAIQSAKARFGDIHGVIHAAGVENPGTLLSTTLPQIRATLSPKVTGTQVLDELLQEEALDFCCYFASSSALLGDFGSCDYAVGNRYQTAYAEYRNEQVRLGLRHGKTVAINWPLWQDGGMFPEQQAQLELYLKTSGLRCLNRDEGLQIFEQLLQQTEQQQPAPHCLVLAKALPSSAVQSPVIIPQPQRREVQEPTIAADPSLHEQVSADLQNQIGELLGFESGQLTEDSLLADLGFDSISLVNLSRQLSDHYQLNITPATFFRHASLASLIEYFVTEHHDAMVRCYTRTPVTVPAAATVTATNTEFATAAATDDVSRPGSQVRSAIQEIAIIGISGRFPGARDVDEFWKLLIEGRDCVAPIPPQRWNAQDYYDPTPGKEGKSCSKWAGLLSDVDQFDAGFFGLLPAEAEMMDPQHRLILEESWRALENAGCSREYMAGRQCGVFVGAAGMNEYNGLLKQAGMVNAFSLLGNSSAMLPTRISYFLNLKGPAMLIDTACSSSLVAVHQACQSIRNGDSEMALAGGVSLLLTPEPYLWASSAGMMSPTGRCRVFDQSADGVVWGEAAAMIVLKDLNQARRDGDYIHGVIKGSLINQDGQSNGITAPNGEAQTALERELYQQLAINPETISYVEAHGTGTRLGDPVEVEALTAAFAEFTPARQFCAIGSVKSNIGHTAAASGIAGLLKVLLAMQHRQLPPSLHLQQENPYIRFAETPFYPVKTPQPWSSVNGQPLRAAISAFGFSGTNAHLVLEQAPADSDLSLAEQTLDGPQAIVLSAKTKAQLNATVEALRQWLADADAPLTRIAATLQLGRTPFRERLAMVVSTTEQLKVELDRYLSSGHVQYLGQQQREHQKQPPLRLSGSTARSMEDAVVNWVSGRSVAWEDLYPCGIRKIPLPGHPFKRKSYWVDAGSADQPEDFKPLSAAQYASEPDADLRAQQSTQITSELSRYSRILRSTLTEEQA
ncbi:SDR family NAD(P)-dependent oxidoreductase [Gynuella sp.]|uniref:SDR family NAD(P)-dependent oxidoreductase n=1 Tax=Gynuella sp. TaxID=2969146 RepID=UPI003D12D858